MATPKQQKFIKLLSENLGNGNTKTLGQIALEAGYSESMSESPHQILQTLAVKEGMSSVVDDLAQLRQRALDELKARDLSEERYADVVKGLDTLTKNHQLLTGGSTENNDINISWQ